MAWSLAISVCLVAAATVLFRPGRKKKTATGRSSSKRNSSAQVEGTGVRRPEPSPRPPKTCPVCLSEYPDPNRFCVRDGAALVEGRGLGPFSQGMICPACRRGYPADASFCPEDAEELVPYGLYGAASSTKPPLRIDANKICPECGIPHAPSHSFCRQDGTELVVVN
ncbi:MAG: hypothetical protein PVH21_18020 [Myxococcales bacterium]